MNMTSITKKYLDYLVECYAKKGWNVPPKWIKFCYVMLENNWIISLYRAQTTRSKYIYIKKNKRNYKIRFSDHKANFHQETKNDCDYYVGVGNYGVITTEQLIEQLNKDLVNENK
jgi:hypothetical protein